VGKGKPPRIFLFLNGFFCRPARLYGDFSRHVKASSGQGVKQRQNFLLAHPAKLSEPLIKQSPRHLLEDLR
jgi:hypothetical protein